MEMRKAVVWTVLAIVLTVGIPGTGSAQQPVGTDLVAAGFPDADANLNSGTAINPIDDLWDEILQKYDTNGNGKLDPREWMQMWRDIQQEQQGDIGWLDITESELIAWLMSLGYNLPDAQQIWNYLKQNYDHNGDCIIDTAEWNDFLKEIGFTRLFLVPIDIVDNEDLILLQTEGLDPFFESSTPTQNQSTSTSMH